jgi:hypothetical protein
VSDSVGVGVGVGSLGEAVGVGPAEADPVTVGTGVAGGVGPLLGGAIPYPSIDTTAPAGATATRALQYPAGSRR